MSGHIATKDRLMSKSIVNTFTIDRGHIMKPTFVRIICKKKNNQATCKDEGVIMVKVA